MKPLKMLVAGIAALGLGVALSPAPAKADTPCWDNVIYVAGYRSEGDVGGPGGIFPWENGGYIHGQSVGAANTVEAVDALAARCPGAIHLVGYSYGAAIVHTALETIDTRHYADRVFVHLYGNPRHPGGVEDFFGSVGMRGAGIRPANVAGFEDLCNRHDGICEVSSTGSIGYLTGDHAYPELGPWL